MLLPLRLAYCSVFSSSSITWQPGASTSFPVWTPQTSGQHSDILLHHSLPSKASTFVWQKNVQLLWGWVESLSNSGPCSVFLTQLCGGIWATTSVIVSPQSRDVQQRRMEKFGHAFMKGYQIPLQWEKSFNGKNVPPPLPDASDISPRQQAFFPLPVSPLGITVAHIFPTGAQKEGKQGLQFRVYLEFPSH